MGISIKTAGGIAIGGIVGFYLINKALNFARQSIVDITEASKWRAYYKHGHEGNMVPPGYSRTNIPGSPNEEYVHPSIMEEREKEEKRQVKEQNKSPIDTTPIAESLERIAKAFMKSKGINLDKTVPTEDTHCHYSDRDDYVSVTSEENEPEYETAAAVDEVFTEEVKEDEETAEE